MLVFSHLVTEIIKRYIYITKILIYFIKSKTFQYTRDKRGNKHNLNEKPGIKKSHFINLP